MSHRFGASIILRVVGLQGNASAFSHQDDAAIVAGRAIYTGFCASCHGQTCRENPIGKAQVPMAAIPLRPMTSRAVLGIIPTLTCLTLYR